MFLTNTIVFFVHHHGHHHEHHHGHHHHVNLGHERVHGHDETVHEGVSNSASFLIAQVNTLEIYLTNEQHYPINKANPYKSRARHTD